jgi:hypothetical protein
MHDLSRQELGDGAGDDFSDLVHIGHEASDLNVRIPQAATFGKSSSVHS